MGYAVAIHHRGSEAEANAVMAEVEAAGGQVVVAADLADMGMATPLIDEARTGVGPLTLVNNASTFEDDRIEPLTAGTWDAHMAAIVRAPILLAQAFARPGADRQSGRPTGLAAERHSTSATQCSKAGLWHATRMLAQALTAPDPGERHRAGPDAAVDPPVRTSPPRADRVPLKRPRDAGRPSTPSVTGRK